MHDVITSAVTHHRFRGCLLGGAVGDALGAPVEFLSRREILKRFGPDGITAYAPAYGALGTITDDTQMTLFTADGLIRGWVRGSMRGVSSIPSVTAHAYLRWLLTQGETPRCDMDFGSDETGWLFNEQRLHHRRAPGNTCLAALREMQHLGDPPRNTSKGCGGVMRAAPVGLFGWRLGKHEYPEHVFELATAIAALTHGHPSGSLAAGAFAVMILELIDGGPLPKAIDAAKRLLRSHVVGTETLQALEHAEWLAMQDLTPADAIAHLGAGWVAEEALAIACYCALVARDFRHGVILAVNHDGDSDSTGAITGNLLGALHGVGAIPKEWLEPLELRDVITTMADDLYAFADWPVGDSGEEWGAEMQLVWERYPGF